MIKIYHSKKYLVEALKTKNYIQISQENKVDTSTIQRYMRRHGLTKNRISWTKKERCTLKEAYGTVTDVYKLFPNRSISSVNHKASKLGFNKIVRKRRYSLNHYFFKKWNSEMVYVLGWFFSDGNVSYDRKSACLHLNSKDQAILEKINKLMSTDRPLSFHSNSVYLRFNSSILVDHLINFGCVPRKSLILAFPTVPEHCLNHFVRGYFDGDGSISFNKPNTIKISFLGTEKFLRELQDRVNKSIKLKSNSITTIQSIHRCQYYGNDARKLCEWMYSDTKDLYLVRKKERFDKHMELRKNAKI